MYIDFDTQFIAEKLCKMAMLENEIEETEKALYHLKAMAQNKYNNDYFRTLVKVLNEIGNVDYLED